MNKKRLIVTSVISVLLVSILMIGSTYSIFTSSDIDERANVYQTGNLDITYTLSEDNVQITNVTPMSDDEASTVIPYRITVTNFGTVPYQFDLILSDTTAGEVIDYHYIMTKVGYLESKALIECTDNVIKEDIIVLPNQSVDIDVRVWLSDKISNDEIAKSFYAKLSIDGLAIYNNSTDIDNSVLALNYMVGFNDKEDYSYYKGDTYREYIKNVSFVDYIDITNAVEYWDMSVDEDNSIVAWVVNNETSGYYDLYIGSNKKIYAESFFHFFGGMSAIENITFDNLDTSLAVDMAYMFWDCIGLISLDLSSFETKNVTYMQWMFAATAGVVMNWVSLDLSSFDTSNVTDMATMFQNCRNLTDLNLSSFDTSNVIDMSYMFWNCISLTSLDLSGFDTSNVTNMYGMFGCTTGLGNMKFTSLDVSNFDTSNVTTMRGMFYNCAYLISLNLSSFDTSSVTNISYMFYNCTNLTNLNLSSFDTSSVTNISYMFYNCSDLITTLTIMSTGTTTYTDIFNGAATESGATITINYTSNTSSLVDSMIATKGDTSNVIKGSLVA